LAALSTWVKQLLQRYRAIELELKTRAVDEPHFLQNACSIWLTAPVACVVAQSVHVHFPPDSWIQVVSRLSVPQYAAKVASGDVCDQAIGFGPTTPDAGGTAEGLGNATELSPGSADRTSFMA
jgi:hypothetical protein